MATAVQRRYGGDGDEEDEARMVNQDPVFSKFLVDDFNATHFASEALRSGSASASAAKLQEGIQLLDKQLRREVLRRHGDLLEQLAGLRDVEHSLAALRAGVDSLQGSARRVRAEVADPYKQISSKSRQASRYHETVELLRGVVRALRLLKRLQELVGPGRRSTDLSKAAQLFTEIQVLRSDAGLEGVEIVDSQASWLSEAGDRIRAEAMKVLDAGMDALNQAEVGSALQVYYNLGELKPTVESVVHRYRARAVKSISGALDMKAISAAGGTGSGGPGAIYRSGTPQLGAGSKARDALWQRLGGCLEQLHSIVVAVWHLQRVLSKQRDPVSHTVFLDEVGKPGEPLLTEVVWEAIVKAFGTQMQSAFTASSFVKETLVVGYPKLLKLVDGFSHKLARDTDVKGVLPAVRQLERQQLVGTLDGFQKGYLGQVLARLTDTVNAMFPRQEHQPFVEQVARLAGRVHEEIEAARAVDVGLSISVVKEVCKVVRLFTGKCECQVSTGPDSRQLTGPATPSQLNNFVLCQSLESFHQRVSSGLEHLPPAASELLLPPLDAVRGVAVDAISPLFKAMTDKLDKLIMKMHGHDFGAADVDDGNGGSGDEGYYVRSIQEATLQLRSNLLSQLLPKSPLAVGMAREVASRVLQLFVRHAALVRPLSEAGRLALARDMAEVELLVGQNLFPVEQLGQQYRALRAFRRLVFADTTLLLGPEADSVLRDLPVSDVLHHLYSRLPEQLLRSPMSRTQVTPAQYSTWLDTVGEAEVKAEVRATLAEFSGSQDDPVYLLMLRLAGSH